MNKCQERKVSNSIQILNTMIMGNIILWIKVIIVIIILGVNIVTMMKPEREKEKWKFKERLKKTVKR